MIAWFQKMGIFNLVLMGIGGGTALAKVIYDFVVSKGRIFNLVCLCVIGAVVGTYIVKEIIVNNFGKKN